VGLVLVDLHQVQHDGAAADSTGHPYFLLIKPQNIFVIIRITVINSGLIFEGKR